MFKILTFAFVMVAVGCHAQQQWVRIRNTYPNNGYSWACNGPYWMYAQRTIPQDNRMVLRAQQIEKTNAAIVRRVQSTRPISPINVTR